MKTHIGPTIKSLVLVELAELARLKFQRGLAAGLGLLTVIFIFAGLAISQNTVTGAFQGRVTNSLNGDAVLGATITIVNEKTADTYTLITDSRGEFFQGLLAPGSYLITIEITQFKPQRLRMPLNISKNGEVVPVPVSLEPLPPGATAPAPITVDADNIRVEINTTDARRDGSFEDAKISAIPIGSTSITRTLDELALLLPGVAPPPQTIGDVAGPGVGPGVGSAGQFAVNGLRSRANNFTVDGSDNNDEDIGVRRQGFVALSSQPVESIQEFQIITLLAPAQFGRNIGAQVNIVSKTGGNKINGSLYGFFNSDKLNARNHFDTTNGNAVSPLRSATGQEVRLNGIPLTVRNQSGGEDSFTAFQGGGTLGGAIVPEKLFYFLSGEYQKINANQEKNFVVPTVEQRGAFRTGATGLFRDPFTNANVRAITDTVTSGAVFSLFPFPNNPAGVFGENTFTQVLPASGRGAILSSRVDYNSEIGGRPQSFTARYNFTDDERNIPAVDEAIFATVLSKVRTHNLSLFLNSHISGPKAETQISNQVRFSIGRTRLNFGEVRDTEFLIPSDSFPGTPFLLNTVRRVNLTQPATPGVANTGPVMYVTSPIPNSSRVETSESTIGPLGQVRLPGFSTLGTDVYNFPQDRSNTTYQIADELSLRLADHTPIFGADIRLTNLASDLPRLARPLVTFNGAPRLIPTAGGFRFPTAADGSNQIIRPEDLLGLGSASDFLLTLNVDGPGPKVDLRYYQLNFYAQDTWRIRPELSVSYGLRYEYNTPVKETSGLIEETFSDPRLSVFPGLSQFIDGRTSLYEPDFNNFAPRLGLAYSPDWFGANRTSVIRAGYGIFYDQVLGAVANQSRNVFPTFVTLNYGGLPSGTTPQILSFFNPSTTRVPGPQGNNIPISAPGTIATFNPQLNLVNFLILDRAQFPAAINATLPAKNLDMPMAHHYSIAFEQQLNANYTLSAAYVGTYGMNLLRFETPNRGSSGIIAPTSLDIVTDDGQLFFPLTRGLGFYPTRPNADIGAVNVFSTTAGSRYYALQTQLRGRFVNRFNFQLSYTFSEATDDVSDVFDLAGASVLPQDSFDLRAERGPANFDVRHRLGYNLIYDFPRLAGNSFVHWLTDGLQISSTGRFHTGQPFTVNSIIDVNLDGNLTDRLNSTSGIVVTGDGRQPLTLTTNNPFTLLAPFGQDGQVGRNSFRAGKVLELDLSATKRFVFGSQSISFRTDIFNLLDRANFGIPIRFLEAPGFGRATNTVTPARRIQFSLKYSF